MNEVQLQDRPPPSRERADSDAPEPIWWRRWFVPPEHPRPLRPVLRSLIGASGALSLLAGALVMIGWHAQKQMLVQVAPAFEPTPYNMGMALLIAGAALLLLPLGLHRLGTTFAAIVTGVGSLTVLEHFTGWDFRIDQLLLTHYFVPEGGAPGRMSIYSAIGITLIGVGALLMHQRSSPWRRFWIATCGSILLALGTVALVGYTMGLTTTYDWGYFTRVSVQGAVVFVLVAATFLIYAWQARDRLEAEAPRWLPLLMGVGVAAGTLYLWQTLFHQERALFDRTMQLALSGTKDEIEARLETRVLTLENTAKRWEIWGHSSRQLLESDARLDLQHYPDLRGIGVMDPNDSVPGVRWIVPSREHAPILGPIAPAAAKLLEAARKQRGSVAWIAHEPRPAFQVNVPMFTGQRFEGFLVGLVDLKVFLDSVLFDKTKAGYGVAVLEGGQEIYDNGETRPRAGRWVEESDLDAYGTVWKVRVWPSRELLSEGLPPLPEVVLIAGLLMSALLSLTLFQAHASRIQARRTEDINEELQSQILERRRAEKELQQFFTLSPDLFCIAGHDGYFKKLNPSWEKVLGYSIDELLEIPLKELVHPEESGLWDRAVERLGEGDIVQVECRLRLKDGEYRWFSWNASQWTAAGITYAVARDIHEQRAARERTQQLNLELEERVRARTSDLKRSNEELQRFAYVVSHDLQEPLRMVASFTQLLAKRYEGKLDEQAHEYIHFAVDGVLRMQQLISDLLTYSRVGSKTEMLEPTNLEEVYDKAIENLRVSIQESGANVGRGPLPTVVADRTQMIQLFQNLIGNALKFRGPRPPEIRVDAEEGEREREGQWVISVKDNGIGIEPSQQKRLFVIFQRLHHRHEYPGTGIGLAICKKIVQHHGGRIWVESEAGQGATFAFTLPKDLKSEPPSARRA